MQITISGQHIEITEPLRNYASEKLVRIQKHFDHLTTTNLSSHKRNDAAHNKHKV